MTTSPDPSLGELLRASETLEARLPPAMFYETGALGALVPAVETLFRMAAQVIEGSRGDPEIAARAQGVIEGWSCFLTYYGLKPEIPTFESGASPATAQPA